MSKEYTELHLLEEAFKRLIDDFILYIPQGKLDYYYLGNAEIAEKIAYNDISFEKFIKLFHQFEDSYLPLLEKLPKRELLRCITTLDRLHHNTLAVASKKYFEVKDNTISALVKLIELRDCETEEHIERTRKYSVLLSKELGLDDTFIDQIYKASLLHDIGKVGVKDSILLKPGKLTAEEFEEVKKHTVLGAQTIDKIIGTEKIDRGYLKMAREIALYHHEKYDGSGYPQGLRAEEIPLAARIIALVDAYDTIVSQRPYKRPIPHEEAIKRILSDNGTHFDPKIVAAFLRISEEFKKINMSLDYDQIDAYLAN